MTFVSSSASVMAIQLDLKRYEGLSSYLDVYRSDFWPLIFDNDHWPTNASSVTGNVDGLMVMIDVDADEFAETTSSTKAAEVMNEAVREAGQADDCSIDIHYEAVRTVYLCTCSKTNVYPSHKHE